MYLLIDYFCFVFQTVLFEWRVGEDEDRVNSFEQVMNAAISGIKNNNFNA